MTERIRLAHGGGGTLMQRLIDEEFRPLLNGTVHDGSVMDGSLQDDPAAGLHDAALLTLPPGRLAFTTDAYVVQPLEFPGGDIGRLAVVGTANDLAMAGARPLRLSLAMILEEGLELSLLRRLVASLAAAARECGVAIVTGDTKVVERGKGDGVFLTTSGIGVVETPEPIHPQRIQVGDGVLVSGDLGRHGVAIMAARHGLDLQPPLASDCAPLWPAVEALLAAGVEIHCLRDLTRGGLASALQELATAASLSVLLEEDAVPVAEPVARSCDLLGFDPLHLANEGRFVAVVPPDHLEAARKLLEPHGGALIGQVEAGPARVRLRTPYGSERLLLPPSGELLPRIC
ncbi:hydrogenase expression/formation protein HypE [Cyanobium sp. FGCU-6]|jgi:hydrogenase expression/formation protein HypE|nr:hydrogenase expression/formation protein HypE [Cyanobium sp. FGCU6]